MKKAHPFPIPPPEPSVISYRRRVLISAALGLAGFAGSFFSPAFVIPPHTISLTWFHIFPLLAAIGYGPRYGLLAGVIGLAAFTPFFAWPTNGWANIVPVALYILFYAWHGYCAEARREKSSLWNNPFIAQIFYAIAYGTAILFSYPVLFSFNPPFWAPTAVSHMPEKVIVEIILKSTAAMFGCVLATVFIYMTPSAKRLLGVSSPKYSSINGKILLTSMISMAGVWFLWQMLNSIFVRADFPKGMFHVGASHEIIALFVIIGTCLVGGYVIALSTEKRNMTEEALRESEEKYRLITENTADLISILDMNLRFKYISPASMRLRGFTVEEAMEQTVEQILTPESMRLGLTVFKEEMQLEASGTADPDRTRVLELEEYKKDGSIIWMEVSLSFLRDKDRNPVGILIVSRDATERKRAEEEKAKLQAQLLQSQKIEAIGQLAGGVAHDFNNMLGVILGHTEMALGQIDPGQPLYAGLEEIRKAASHSADLTRQLLTFARKQPVSPKVLDLNETIDGMLKMLRRLIGEDIHLQWLPDPALWLIKVDPSQIDQVLANLCVNARDAIAGVGKVTIETGNIRLDEAYCADHAGFVPGEYVQLCVSDSGCGMDKGILEKLFEPFFTTKGVGQGTGLGLATVYGVVKQNNGFINVYSEPGHGATFKIYLPRHAGEAERTKTKRPQEPVMRGHETVLVVEDEPSLLELSKLMLENQGYRVLAAGTPGEAILLAEGYAGEIHLLMTDVVMPEMNGPDLAKKMLSRCPDLKCLFTSGYPANVISHHGILDEGVYFIQKPFSRKDLAAKVREVLDQKLING